MSEESIQIFSSKFKRQKTPEGRIQYWFETSRDADIHSLAVEGDAIPEEICQETTKIPEETMNPAVLKRVFETWINDCSGSFVKSPTIEQCLANASSVWDSNAPIVKVNEDERDEPWVYLWAPTKVKVDMPSFHVYWAPSYKTKIARIPEFNTPLDQYDGIEVNAPEKPYIISSDGTRLITARDGSCTSEWLQELNDSALPLSDAPALRLELTEADQLQRDKHRRRVREARIRAKLARYRAERLAERYEERFGVYPEEDEEEARTEVEGSDED